MQAVKEKIIDIVHPSTETKTTTTVKETQCRSTTEKSLALVWRGKEKVAVESVGKPMLAEPCDAIVKVTTTSICGSDLHLYLNALPGMGSMKSGDILGHEAMGIIEEVGSGVSKFKPGDRVVISCVIACGKCQYCTDKNFSCCDTTNPSGDMEKMFGHRTAALFGYSHLTGGYDGCQAEYVRVPLADVNCLKVPTDLPDEKLILLSDVLCTAWHGCELAEVKPGDVVGVWGCGPIGLACQALCKLRGASKVIAIDNADYRLNIAKTSGCDVIDFDKEKVIDSLQKLCPGGLDACIDCAGYRFPKSKMQKIERALSLETDALNIVNEMVKVCKKAGHIALIGDYFAFGNHFPIGPFMEKSITMRGGQVFVQKYWETLLGFITEGKFDPTFLITHTLPFTKAADGYKMFCNHEDGCVKVLLKPQQTVGQR
jgi:threonine dehydrogenase-like Zn-dependent dehydrogenase